MQVTFRFVPVISLTDHSGAGNITEVPKHGALTARPHCHPEF